MQMKEFKKTIVSHKNRIQNSAHRKTKQQNWRGNIGHHQEWSDNRKDIWMNKKNVRFIMENSKRNNLHNGIGWS